MGEVFVEREEGIHEREIFGMDIPLRLIIPIGWPTKPYGVTAYYDQMGPRTGDSRVKVKMRHANNQMK